MPEEHYATHRLHPIPSLSPTIYSTIRAGWLRCGLPKVRFGKSAKLDATSGPSWKRKWVYAGSWTRIEARG